MAQVIKNSPANERDVRDSGSIPKSGKSLEEGMATHSSILAQRIPWTEEPGGLQSMGSQTDTTEQLTLYIVSIRDAPGQWYLQGFDAVNVK